MLRVLGEKLWNKRLSAIAVYIRCLWKTSWRESDLSEAVPPPCNCFADQSVSTLLCQCLNGLDLLCFSDCTPDNLCNATTNGVRMYHKPVIYTVCLPVLLYHAYMRLNFLGQASVEICTEL